MTKKSVNRRKIHFQSSVAMLYAVTLLVLWQAFLGLAPFITGSGVQASNEIKMPLKVVRVSAVPSKKVQSGVPSRIVIPTLELDKEILPGVYDKSSQTWNISDTGVHYAQPSVPVNDSGGSTLIYGHNNHLAFGKLQYMDVGDPITVYTENKLKFSYVYKGKKDYNPSDTSIFSYKGEPSLVLQTCTGYFNEIRTLHSFELKKVEKA